MRTGTGYQILNMNPKWRKTKQKSIRRGLGEVTLWFKGTLVVLILPTPPPQPRRKSNDNIKQEVGIPLVDLILTMSKNTWGWLSGVTLWIKGSLMELTAPNPLHSPYMCHLLS